MTTSNPAAEAATPLPPGGESGDVPDLRLCVSGMSRANEPMTDAQARIYLAGCCDFLRQIAQITAGVVETIGIGRVRDIVAAEIPLGGDVIDENGKYHATETPARADHRKEPRGRKHPVITLLQMALQGVRLLLKIIGGTNPNTLNNETLEQKQMREEAKEAERSFKALLRG